LELASKLNIASRAFPVLNLSSTSGSLTTTLVGFLFGVWSKRDFHQLSLRLSLLACLITHFSSFSVCLRSRRSELLPRTVHNIETPHWPPQHKLAVKAHEVSTTRANISLARSSGPPTPFHDVKLFLARLLDTTLLKKRTRLQLRRQHDLRIINTSCASQEANGLRKEQQQALQPSWHCIL
jgi:hypothetical protein